jgi:hypothetical protein
MPLFVDVRPLEALSSDRPSPASLSSRAKSAATPAEQTGLPRRRPHFDDGERGLIAARPAPDTGEESTVTIAEHTRRCRQRSHLADDERPLPRPSGAKQLISAATRQYPRTPVFVDDRD